MRIRPYRAEHAEQAFQLRVTAFSGATHVEYDADEIYIPDEHRLVAVDDGEVVGHLGVWPFNQAFHRHAVPMGGVGAVVVADHRRGEGIATRLLEAGLAHMADAGMAISTLYPSTPVPYRRWGWAYAGVRMRRRIATRDLLDVPPAVTHVTLRPYAASDLDAVVAVHDAVTTTEPGGLVCGTRWLQRALQPDPDDPEIAHVAVRDHRVVGLLLLAKTAPSEAHGSYDVDVLRLFGVDRDVERALWRAVAHHHTTAPRTAFVSRPADPLLFDLRHGLEMTDPSTAHFMTRLVDVQAAIGARGWPPGSATVHLDIVDPQHPTNAGRYVLELDDRTAVLTAGGTGRVTIDIAVLSSLYTGFLTATDAARDGRLPGATTADVIALTDAFAGPTPFLRDFF
ncbi:MAG: GNAT family N-acetyltransferase [Actinobacteria bacterium]|nr:GNAT family N-acetyltransferase [Actinomycetota bacterium]